jgi:hypothetical protein
MPPNEDSDPILGFLVRADSMRSSSIILRTYICLVLGRTDGIVEAFRDLERIEKTAEISAALKLLRNDGVRELRNAIGHGTYLARANSLIYDCKDSKAEFSFPELEALNTSIVSIIMAAWAASCRNY